MTSPTRHETRDRPPLRTQGVFCTDGKWFFATREGTRHGAYASRQAAEAALATLLRTRGAAHTRSDSAPAPAREREPGGDRPGQGFSFYW